MLKATGSRNVSPANQDRWSYYRLPKKYECLIEVKIVYSSHRWQEEVSSKMMQTMAKLRVAVEELDGKIRVRY